MSSDDEDLEEIPDTTTQQEQQQQLPKYLEQELEAVTLELTTVRTERDKQRQQLDQLKVEHEQLTHQKELRLKRHQLSEQLQDLQSMADKKVRHQQIIQEELEQTKSHHRQLRRTLNLLQTGVEQILEKSAATSADDEHARERQRLLKHILVDEEHYIAKLLGGLTIMQDHQSKNPDKNDEDEEIHEDNVVMFSRKSRKDSIDSMVSEIFSMGEPSPMIRDYRKQAARRSVTQWNNNNGTLMRTNSTPPERSSRSQNRSDADRSRSQSRSRLVGGQGGSEGSRSRSHSRTKRTTGETRSRSKSRSKKDGKDGGARDRSRSKSNRSRARRGKSSSKTRTAKDQEHPSEALQPIKKKSSPLLEMLETQVDDDDSQDTPKTHNTRDDF
jgi:hypothetical protein